MANIKADHKIDLVWVAHVCNYSTWEGEAGDQLWLHSKFKANLRNILSPKNNIFLKGCVG